EPAVEQFHLPRGLRISLGVCGKSRRRLGDRGAEQPAAFQWFDDGRHSYHLLTGGDMASNSEQLLPHAGPPIGTASGGLPSATYSNTPITSLVRTQPQLVPPAPNSRPHAAGMFGM